MARNIEEFVILLNDKVTSKLKKTGVALDNVRDKADRTQSGFKKLGRIAAGAFAAIGIAQVGREVINTLAEFEKFEAVLTNTLGSNSAAQQALQDITDFAAKTPFQVDGLTGAFVKLANQGFVPTLNEMRKLGDLASSTGKDFDQLAEAVIDAQTGEFERLKEFGIRAKKEGDKVTFTFKGVETQTDFTAAAMREYVLSLGDATGVSGSMAAISKTTGGQISNLLDKVTQLALKLGTALRPAITATIQALSALVGWITDNLDVLVTIGIAVGVVATAWAAYNIPVAIAAIQTGILTAAQWALNFALTANPIGIVVVAIGALVIALVAAWRHSETFRGTILGLWEAIQIIGANIGKVLIEPLLSLRDVWAGIIDIFSGNGPDKLIAGLKRMAKSIITLLVQPFLQLAKVIDEMAGTNFAVKLKGFTGMKDVTEGTGKAFGEGFAKGAKEVGEKNAKGDGAAALDAARQRIAGGGKGSGAGGSGVKAGIAGVRSSAPKQVNLNIQNLVEELNINTQTLNEGMAKVKEEVSKALLAAANDVNVIQ